MITLVQQYDNYYSKIAELTTDNKLQYASKYNYGFISYEQELTQGDDWYWHNTLGVLKAIHDDRAKGDWIFWTDVDSLIMNNDIDIADYVKNISDDVQIIASFWVLPSQYILSNLSTNIVIHKVHYSQGIMHQIHTGNFLIRRSSQAVQLLQRMYEDRRFRERPEIIIPGSGDEAAYAIYYLAYPDIRSQYKFLPSNFFCTIPTASNNYIIKFNMNKYMYIEPYRPRDFILHALGRWDDLTDIADWKYEVLKNALSF